MTLKKDITAYIFLLFSILFQSFSFILGKLAANHLDQTSFLFIIVNPYYLLSLFALGIQAVFWQKTLEKLALSKAYPYTGLLYVLILLYSYFIFDESINIANVIGIVLIIVGIFIMNLDIKESSKKSCS